MDCEHWVPYSSKADGLAEGDCTRYPPYVPIIGSKLRGMPMMGHPITYGAETCGEWKEKSVHTGA